MQEGLLDDFFFICIQHSRYVYCTIVHTVYQVKSVHTVVQVQDVDVTDSVHTTNTCL